MTILLRHLLVVFIVFFLLVACSSSENDSKIALNSEAIKVAVENEASIIFPVDSTAGGDSIQIVTTELPLLPNDFEGLGKAYHVANTGVLKKLVDIEIVIPSNESATDLYIVKISETGLLTVLQSDVSNGWLTAKTDSFSTLFLSRIPSLKLPPVISGPSLLPVGEFGLYQETRFSSQHPDLLDLDWQVFGAGVIDSTDGRSIYVKAIKEGRIDIALTAVNSGVGYQGFASLVVSAQQLVSETQANRDGTVADEMIVLLGGGPTSISLGESVNLTGKVINNSSDIVSWHWSTGSDTVAGDSCNGCETPFVFPTIVYNKIGKYTFELDAVDSQGNEASTSVEIAVLPAACSLSVAGPTEIDTTKQLSATYSAVLNEPNDVRQCNSYNFDWKISPDIVSSYRVSMGPTDEVEATFIDVGTYAMTLAVSCSGGESNNVVFATYATPITVKGEQTDLSMSLRNIPTSIEVNESINGEIRVDGGIVIVAGVKGKYKLTIDWDDGEVEEGEITPYSGSQGGFANPQHSYEEAGVYTVKFLVVDASGNTVSKSTTIEVTDPSQLENNTENTFSINTDIEGFNVSFNPDLIAATTTTGAEHIVSVSAIENPTQSFNNQNFFSIQMDSIQISGSGIYDVGVTFENIAEGVAVGEAIASLILKDIKHVTSQTVVGLAATSGTLNLSSFGTNKGDRLAGSYSVNIAGERIISDDEEDNTVSVTGRVFGEFSVIVQ